MVFVWCIVLQLINELLVDWHHQLNHMFQAHFTWQSSNPMTVKYILSVLSIWLPNLTYLNLACIIIDIYDDVLNTQHIPLLHDQKLNSDSWFMCTKHTLPDSRFRHHFVTSYRCREHGFVKSYGLIVETEEGPSHSVRSCLECATCCFKTSDCTGYSCKNKTCLFAKATSAVLP